MCLILTVRPRSENCFSFVAAITCSLGACADFFPFKMNQNKVFRCKSSKD